MNRKLLSICALFLLMQSCVSLKPYERIYVNDPEMQFGADATDNFRNYVFKIREGSTPAGSGKASGGCGCN